MKKYLSIILSLVLILGTVFIAPAASVSAEGAITGFDLNGWYVAPGTNGYATPNAENQSVHFIGVNYRAMYTTVSNLEVGKTYELSFDITPKAALQLWVVPGTETISWDQGLPTNTSRKHIVSVTGTTFVAQITPETTSLHFVFRNQTDTAATNEFTLSNFSFAKASAETVAGIAIADGTWKSTNGKVTNNTTAHTVTAEGLQYHSIYTTVSNLTPNTVYKLTFDMSANIGFKQLWLAPGSQTLNLGGGTYPQNSGTFTAKLSTSGTKFVAEFTASETSYHFVFRDHDATVSNITLSNFKLEVVKTLTEADIAGNAIADGVWKVTAGTVSNNKTTHTVSLKTIGYQAAYTTVTGLKANSIYEISFDMSVAGGFKQLWLVSGDETIQFSNSLSGYPENNLGSAKVSTNGTRFIAQFTASQASYHLVFRNYENVVTDVDFSNFNFKEIILSEEEIAGKNIANNGDWAVTKNAGGTVTKSNDTVTITGAQYQQISLALTGLKANTTYTLNFNHTAGDVWQFANPAYVIPGETAWTSGLNSKSGTITYGDGSANTNDSTTIRFTTNATDSDYLVVFSCNAPYSNDILGTVVLTNFTFASETAYEFKGTAIRASSENVEQGMRFKNTISKDLIANGYNGKEVVEYGNIVAYENNITTDFTYENVDGKNIKKGVAFNKIDGTNVVFAETDESIDYTVVLTGIKSAYYNRNCKVRSYVLLSDGSVIYGDVQTYCVYAMFQAVLNGDNDSDKAVVNNILANETINSGYNAWLAK